MPEGLLKPVSSFRRSSILSKWTALASLDIAIRHGYFGLVDISVAEAKNRLPELIRAMEGGETVIITRHGKPVAQIAPVPPERRRIRWGAMRDRVKLLPGWDDPITEEQLLGGQL